MAAAELYRRVVPAVIRRRLAELRQRMRHLPARLDPPFLRSQARLRDLRDRHAGETCVIAGNGPSMRGFDLARLAGRKTFCLNRGYLLWKEQNLTPDYLIAVNALVIAQFATELQSVEVPTFVPWTQRRRFDTERADLVFFEERWGDVFVTDVRNGIAPMSTVTNAALQLAYHMGFSTVILIGVDHVFHTSGRPHAEVRLQIGDRDHFTPDYFGPGVAWNLPDLAGSERGYRLARETYEAAARRILNATPGTRLDTFETAQLDVVLPTIR